MNEDLTSMTQSEKVNTILVGVGVAGGLLFGIIKKSGFLGTLGYTVGFGIVGAVAGAVASKLIQKT